MNTPRVSIITWNRKRRNAAGKLVRQRRYGVSYKCPDTGSKRRISFSTKAKAEEYRQVLMAEFVGERYFNPNLNPTVTEVVTHWLDNKRGSVKAQTIRGYLPLIKCITGPLLQGTSQERVHYALTGENLTVTPSCCKCWVRNWCPACKSRSCAAGTVLCERRWVNIPPIG